jgi:hypothetical protein
MEQKNINKKLGKPKCTHIGVRFGHPLIFRMRDVSINGLVCHTIRTIINIELNNKVTNISIRFV